MARKNNQEARNRRAEGRTERFGALLEWFGATLAKGGSDRPFVRQVKIKLVEDATDEWLVVLLADGEDGPVVGFHSDYGLADALRGAIIRYQNKALKWKVDEYAK